MSRHATSKGSGGGFKPEIGIHNVVCVQLVDFGEQPKEWAGKIIGTAPKINIGFEFVDIELEGENGAYHPLWGIQETNSTGKKANLRKFIDGWRGKPLTEEEAKSFDVGALLGQACQLVIGLNKNNNPKVDAIVRANQKLEPTRELKEFFMEEDYNGDLPDWLMDWMKDRIAESVEYIKAVTPENFQEPPAPEHTIPPSDEYEDDIPF